MPADFYTRPMPVTRFAAPRRALRFLPAIALAVGGALIATPWAVVATLVAIALALAAAASILERDPAAAFVELAVTRAAAALFALLIHALAIVLAVGVPAALLLNAPTPGKAFLASLGVVAAVLTLWRHWPLFGLAYLLPRDPDHPDDRSAIVAVLVRAQRHARALAARHDAYFHRGLGVALAIVGLNGGALAIAAATSVLGADLARVLGLTWAIVYLPLAALFVIAQTRALLRLDAGARQALPVAATPAAAPVIVLPRDPARQRAALLERVRAHDIDAAVALVKAGADPNAAPDALARDQRSALAVAATSPDLRLLRALIEAGADVNRAHGGLTALLAATRDSYGGRPDAVLTLIANGARTDLVDADGNSALHHAARTRDALVTTLLLDAGAATALANRDGYTPLGVALAAGNAETALLLIDRGALDAGAGAVPPLIALAQASDDLPELAKKLIKAKVDIDARDALGRTALIVAAFGGHRGLVQTLLHAGAAVDAIDARGVNALIEAARAGELEIVRILGRAGADIAKVDRDGRSALGVACASRAADVAVIDALLKLGADPHARAGTAPSALDEAIAAGRWPLIARLDPAYPLPSAIREVDLAPELDRDGLDRGTLLTAAIAHARFDVASALIALTPPLDDAARRGVTLALTIAPYAAIDWWLARAGNAALVSENGATLLEHAFAEANLDALEALDARGVGCAGGAALARLLALAALDGDPARRARIETLALGWLARGADPFASHDGLAPIHLAVSGAMVGVAAELIARGIDPNQPDARGSTPLVAVLAVADAARAQVLVECLLVAGADPERRACRGDTALGRALASGRPALAEALAWHGAFRLPLRRLRADDLPRAAALGDRVAVSRLLGFGFDVDAVDGRGASALIRAAGGGQVACFDALLDAGADPTRRAASGIDALGAAITAGHDAVVARWIARGLPIDRPLDGAITPLQLAAASGADDIAARLLDAGADARALDARDNGALHAACGFAFAARAETTRCSALIDRLIAAGAAVDARNRDAATPLLLLLGAHVQPGDTRPAPGRLALLERLLAAGADTTAQDMRGVGALHACAIHGQHDLVAPLLAAGAPRDARDRLNRSAADLALMLGYADLAVTLKVPKRQAL